MNNTHFPLALSTAASQCVLFFITIFGSCTVQRVSHFFGSTSLFFRLYEYTVRVLFWLYDRNMQYVSFARLLLGPFEARFALLSLPRFL